MLKTAVLLLLVIASAVAVVYCQHRSRRLFDEMTREGSYLRSLETERQKLQLEMHTLAEPSRVEQLARGRMEMHLPAPEDIRYLRP